MILLIVVIVVLLFGFVVVLGGPPYLPTKRRQIDAALDLLNLKPGQTLLELGSGDGRVLQAAAKRGLKAVGIELNPLLVLVSRLYTWRYRKQVRVMWGDYLRTTWPIAQGIFAFLIPRHMAKVDKRVAEHAAKPVRLASFAFAIPNKKAEKQKNGVFLYNYR